MKVNGYQLQRAVRYWRERINMLEGQFIRHRFHFPSDAPVDFLQIGAHLVQAEQTLARLQVYQTRYNLAVEVEVDGRQIPLLEAIKRIGGAGRIEKLWRETARGKGEDRYHIREHERPKDSEFAELAVPLEQAMEQSRLASRTAGELREAVAVGNATEVELEDLEASLLGNQ